MRCVYCVALFFITTFLHVLLLACHTALRFFPSLRVLDLLVRVVIAGFTIMLLEQTLFLYLALFFKSFAKSLDSPCAKIHRRLGSRSVWASLFNVSS
jgi:hypothetical protein